MRRLYVICGAAGGLIAGGIVTYRVYSHFHSFAVSAERYDVQLNVLLFFGIGIGILLLPLGVGVGVLVAALVSRCVDYLSLKPPEGPPGGREDSQTGGSSWVNRRPER
jgi:hypothetical protein